MNYLLFFLLFWQQKVAYRITATLDVNAWTLNENLILTYCNNSPVPLETIYLHLYPNAYRDSNTTFAKELKRMGENHFLKAKPQERGGIDILSAMCQGDSLNYFIDGEILAFLPKNPLISGDSVIIEIAAFLKIPKIFSRLGYWGKHVEIVQWYPKFCVFDQRGWHKEPYHAIGEFYGEYGRYDVRIELPADYVIASTGEFIDSIVLENRRKIMHFFAEDVHDFALVCNPDFVKESKKVDNTIIEVYYTKKDKKKWKNAMDYTADAFKRYNRWFGKYPYKRLGVVQRYFSGGMEYPNLVIIGGGEEIFKRQFEQVIIHEIAHQWFYGILGSNEMDEAWLDEGFTTYAEMRYFIDKYGTDNSFLKSRIFPKFPHSFIYRFIYYINQTNKIELPVLTKSSAFIDIPFAYQNSAYAKPALFLYYLENYLGRDTFDLILREYFKRYKFSHPYTQDFVNLCEEISGRELDSLFEDFLRTTKYCDWHIKGIKGDSIVIENNGELLLPVDLFVETDNGKKIFRIEKAVDTVVLSNAGRIKKIALDPYNHAFESNRFNNFYPRRCTIKPIFSMPSFDTYQVFFLPYLWYDTDNGFTFGVYLAGAQFIDFDFIKGKNQWLSGYTYGMRRKEHSFKFYYQTPIVFKKGYRLRLFFKGSNGYDEINLQSGFMNNFGIPFTIRPGISIKNILSYDEFKSYLYVDSVDWSIGKYYSLRNEFQYHTKDWFIGFEFNSSYFNEVYNFLKTTLEVEHKHRLISLRIFNGRVLGTPPNQEKIFLCGGLRHNFITALFFNYKSDFSPQEHIHIKKDANMAGYQGMHIKTTRFSGFNFQLPQEFPFCIFFDYGYYYDDESKNWQCVWDGGIQFLLGPIGFILPIFNREKFFPQNWSLELTFKGLNF